jgi:putative transposase
MRTLGLQGIRRAKGVRTTIPAKDGRRAGDLLNRDFTACAPNRTWVMDFTYVRTWAGFVYVAFIVDVFAQKIVAWNAATTKDTDLVMTPLRMAIWQRDRDGHPIVPGELIGHADAGSQGGFNWSSQHLDRWRCWVARSSTGSGRAVRRSAVAGASEVPSSRRGARSGRASPRACCRSRHARWPACRRRSGAVVSPRWRHATVEI